MLFNSYDTQFPNKIYHSAAALWNSLSSYFIPSMPVYLLVTHVDRQEIKRTVSRPSKRTQITDRLSLVGLVSTVLFLKSSKLDYSFPYNLYFSYVIDIVWIKLDAT